MVGLSEINSKNYDIILDKVKFTPITPVTSSSISEYSDNVYNIKTEIKQQQKHLSNNEVLEIISKESLNKSSAAGKLISPSTQNEKQEIHTVFHCFPFFCLTKNLTLPALAYLFRASLEIISKYKAGKSTYELAQEYGCHRRTISDNLKKQGIKVTNQLMEHKGVV